MFRSSTLVSSSVWLVLLIFLTMPSPVYALAPTISSFTPKGGKAGNTVTIDGTNFTGATTVKFNYISAVFSLNSDTSITATVPVGNTAGRITVTTLGGQAISSGDFQNPPKITSFTPTSGGVDTYIQITGTGMTGVTRVLFNGIEARDWEGIYGGTFIVAGVPEGATTGPISVENPLGTATSAMNFTVLPTPTISSFMPSGGIAGDTVTITGTNFTGAIAVRFKYSVSAVFTLNSDTSITASVPVGDSAGPIAVQTPGGQAISSGDFLNPPKITSFTPTIGDIGAFVNITGTGLSGVTKVWFNAIKVTYFYGDGDGMYIRAQVPEGATTGPISVENPLGAATSATNFTVNPPTITSFTPTSGGVDTYIKITGTGLSGVTKVRFNGIEATSFYVSSTFINAGVPEGATTGPISVENPLGTATSAMNFTFFQPPTISSFTPNGGIAGDIVTIAGTNFTGATTVEFSGISAVFTLNSDTSIKATVPVGNTAGRITVTTPGGTAISSGDFLYPPKITSFTPTSGGVDTYIEITGTGMTGVTRVLFNGIEARGWFGDYSGTQIYTQVPEGATTGPISVENPLGTATSAMNFTFFQPPTISSFTPNGGIAGDTVTINGTNFTGATTVEFNDLSAVFTLNSDISITATVPVGNTGGRITVTTPGGIAISSGDFLNPPKITSFTPTSGGVDTSIDIEITGTGLIGVTKVRFHGIEATYFYVNSNGTYIDAQVPKGATTGPISVENPIGTATSAAIFTVLPTPTISSFTPNGGIAGDTVTITGTNFTGATIVKFNGISAVFTLNSDASIKSTTPVGVTNGYISVTTPGGIAYSSDVFWVSTPTITSFTPTSGSIGTYIEITGTGLIGVTKVRFHGIEATYFSVNYNGMYIRARVPKGATTGSISVGNPIGTATSAAIFTVLPTPTISSFTPNGGIAGDTVTITGTNLTGATAVWFHYIRAVFTLNSDTSITATVPVGDTAGPIAVQTPGGIAYSSGDFLNPPTITLFTPASGSTGANVEITGTSLIGVTKVRFCGIEATSFYVSSNDTIYSSVPEGATTGPVSVENPLGTATSVDNFYINHLPSLAVNIDPGSGYIGALSNTSLIYSLSGPQPYTSMLTPDNGGKSIISGLQPGTYDLSIAGSHWLRRVIKGINVNGADSVNSSLINGDADGNNGIDLFDFVVLDSQFGSADTMADLDGDGQVNLFDYVFIDQNFGAKGDESDGVKLNPTDGAEMVWVPAGEFAMGSNSAMSADETPRRTVYLDGYWMYKYEVTVAQYRAFCQSTNRVMPTTPNWGWQDKHPMVNVSWQDAVDYASWAGVALPTEAQWEKAAKGTDGRAFPWGNAWDASKCSNYYNSPSGTMPVGSFPAAVSPYGCMDMAGNAQEWCADWYDYTYYQIAPGKNPTGPSESPYGARVLRGEGWISNDDYSFRCAYRSNGPPAYHDNFNGFRCARTE